MIFTMKSSNVFANVSSYVDRSPFFRCCQKRTVYSLLVNKILYHMKERKNNDCQSSFSKLYSPECIQFSSIYEDTKFPFLKEPLVMSSTENKPIHVLAQNILKRQNSLKQSTESVLQPNRIKSSIINIPATVSTDSWIINIPSTVSTDSAVRNFRRNSSSSSSGLDSLINANNIPINNNLLHRENHSVHHFLGNHSVHQDHFLGNLTSSSSSSTPSLNADTPFSFSRGYKILENIASSSSTPSFSRGYHSVHHILGNIASSSTPTLNADTALFFSIFMGILITQDIYPLHILTMPTYLNMYSITKEYIRDVYVNHVCITHQIPSPCNIQNCNESFNEMVKTCYPQISFDPLGEHPPQKLKNITYTIGTLLLLVILVNKTGNVELVV